MKLAGSMKQKLPSQPVRLKEPVKGRKDWTRFVFGKLEQKDQHFLFVPDKKSSRLRSMAEAQCVITIPEGVDHISEGTEVMGTMLV